MGSGNHYGVADFFGDLWRDHNERQYVAQVNETVGTLQEQALAWKQRAEHYRKWECVCRMMLTSFQQALKRSDPDHPFVKDDYLFNDFIAQAQRITTTEQNDEVMRQKAVRHAFEDYPVRMKNHVHMDTLSGRAMAKIEADRVALERNAQTIAGTRRDLADHRAERIAYRAAVQAIDPEHPLLKSRDLRDRLRRAASLAFDFEADPDKKWAAFDASVLDFMKTEVPQAEFTRASAEAAKNRHEIFELVLKNQIGDLERDLCDHRAQKVVFRSELARIAPGHPLVTDSRLRQGISEAAGKAFAFAPAGSRYEALDEAALGYFQEHVSMNLAEQFFTQREAFSMQPAPGTAQVSQLPAQARHAGNGGAQPAEDGSQEAGSTRDHHDVALRALDADRVAAHQLNTQKSPPPKHNGG